jgi:hypothetical protein
VSGSLARAVLLIVARVPVVVMVIARLPGAMASATSAPS